MFSLLKSTLDSTLDKKSSSLWIFVGLSNPGKEYEKTRHNAGLLALDYLREKWGFPDYRQKGQVQWTQGFVGSQKVILAHTTTYMNLSGQGLSSFSRMHNNSEWLVFHDELDLPAGHVRWKEGGGHGGHNGLRSLEGILPKNYQRLRLGIGRPPEKHQVSHYVLSPFSKEHMEALYSKMDQLSPLFPLLFEGKKNIFAEKLQNLNKTSTLSSSSKT